MIICSCNVLSDTQMRAVADEMVACARRRCTAPSVAGRDAGGASARFERSWKAKPMLQDRAGIPILTATDARLAVIQ